MTVNPNVNGKVMNLEDGDGLETSNRGDGAHDMMVRFEKVVLAPRGETGSITQMPPTTPLHPHSSAISTLSNISNPIHCQPLDSCLHISSLSSLNKLLLPGTLRIGPSTHVDTFFVDCGADDLFVDSKLAADLHIPLVKLSTPIQLRLADGDSSSVISHRTVPLQLHIGSHVETALFYVTNLCHGIILGYSWLERHNPRVNWVSRLVDFDSPYCMENCCVGSSRIQGLGKPPDTNKCFPPTVVSDTSKSLVQLNPISGDYSLASILSLDSIQEGVYPFVEASPLSESGVPADILSQFESVFSKDLAETLPPHRDFDCSIELIPGSVPAYGKIYHLTREEDTVMQEWIKDNLRQGFIRSSSSPHGAPCFFVKQKDKLRLCMDYRGLNKNTIKDRNPIPLISEMLRTLSTGKVFTTLDLRGAYNLLRIKEGDEPKTSFITKYGQFEFLVMPFGLANAPAQFQRMMNALFRDVVGKHVLVYLDDIVIYSDTMDEHVKQVQSVLGVLRDNGLYCKAEKCHFYQTEIKYLGYIISSNGIRMDPSKISAVQEWPTPRKVRDLQVFLGFTNFYRSLIKDYSNMTCHLTKLFKKDSPFVWGPEQEKSLQALKDAFAHSDFLTHPDETRPFIVETDASDYAISGVLSQYDDTDVLRPIAFYARQMNSAERNYEIYDKELLAVVDSFKHWRHFLQGGHHPVTVLCDHKNLEYFMTTKKLTRRQARWSLELSEYDFTLTHRPGKLNGRADPLSRRHDYLSENDTSNFQRILDPKKVIDLQALMVDMDLHLLVHSVVLQKVFVLESDWPLIIADFLAGEDNVWMDDIPDDVMDRCKKELKNFRFRDNSFLRILEDGKSTAAYVSTDKRVDIMNHYHTSLAHLKYGSIIDLLNRRFWWPTMKKDLKDYIARCPECQLDQSASGVHSPLPIRPVPPVALPFERWGIDFYGPMVETKSGNKYLITCIDYATRWVLAKPVKDMTESAVSAFLYELMMTYGAPFEIISDRGKSFLAEGIDLFERENRSDTWPRLLTIHRPMRDRWDEYLPQVLLALRTRTHAVTKFSPFFLLFGIHPRLPTDETPPQNTLAPLDDIEQMEENSEFIARNLEEVGQARSAANVRTKAQAEAMRKRNNFDETTPDYFFKVGDMVKMKHHDRLKLEFRWKGPYHVVDVGHPGTYWIMTPQGLRLPNAVNQNDLAPWLAPVVDNIDFFYDGTNRNTALTGDETSTSH
ncbi:hypothetical protein BASA50_010428 [Batrachochytrium salamandrivorans]|uniref:RNA-directed DNA polymerase n=1 Tax=Batrachochytrium salamandrivorans TaxID=1357716 RepID=A0ABQ8EZ21_9FUNG|nr:hypothetical protein BASA50_010428 [Batrachochytrium salamandrivorans]